MRYYRIPDGRASYRLVARNGDSAHDLTTARPELTSFTDLARAATLADRPVDEVARKHVHSAASVDVATLQQAAARPVVPDEVWAVGATYHHVEDEAAFREENDHADMTLMVYDPKNPPELFFKGTASRTVGHGEHVGIRTDTDYNVAEPELTLVLYRGEIVGYTLGFDMSASGLLRQNPLYLSATKIFERCCAIGPSVVSASAVTDPHDLEIRMTVERDGEIIFEECETTGAMLRSLEDLPAHITTHDTVAETTLLLTGGPFAPADTLREGDILRSAIDEIGVLENPVIGV